MRDTVCVNRDWRFTRGDPAGAAGVDFEDSSWQHAHLPHCFDLPYFRTPEFYVGVGWYRKRLHWPADSSSRRRCWLHFEAAFQVADVYCNGMPVAHHAGGYTGFVADLSDSIRPGENVIAVRVSNEWNAQLAPRAGEHIFSGGLYRDVWLHTADAVHIAPFGVRFTTPDVSTVAALAHVDTTIRNTAGRRQVVDLQVELRLRNELVAQRRSTIAIEPKADSVVSADIDVLRPELWSPASPTLYDLIVRTTAVDADGSIHQDECRERVGFRWFEFTADRGFFLNGEHFHLRGANAHQDHAGWGIGVTRAAMRRDVRLLKDAGFNFVRGAHYPHGTAFTRACDEIGLLLWCEAPFWGKGGFGPEGFWNASAYPIHDADFEPFESHCLQSLDEMIRDHGNSPAVFAWSMCNEPFFSFHQPRVRALLSKMVERSRQLDPHRPAAIGGAQRGEIDRLGDVAGYNGDGARLFIDPGVPNLVSEYGAMGKPHETFEPFFGDLANQPRFAWRSGEAIWCGFDYGTIAGKQGLKGIIDHFRLPKQSWQWYREHLRGIDAEPWPRAGVPAALRIELEKKLLDASVGLDDVQVIVTVHDANGERVSNSPAITLDIESGPGEFPTGRTITFAADSDIAVVGGRCAIAMRSYHGGVCRLRASSPGLASATAEIECVGPAWDESLRAPDRPYSPPPPSTAAIAALNNAVNVARDRPSRASSFDANHPPRFANDAAGKSTAWLAAADDSSPTWTLDLEGFYEIASDRLTLPSAGNFRYVVDVSLDGSDWKLACDRSASVNESAERVNVYDPGTVARYIRLSFTHVPPGGRAGVAEFEVFGILSNR